jgi:metallo-beta-lactamase family protein
MKLHFLGANRQVTGSRYMLDAGGKQVLIDCGMFQEREFLGRNWERSPIPPGEIDAMLLTHAHLDHCGLIPRLAREGYRGPIYCTAPTVPLAELVMQDSAEIQAEDAAYKKKRHAREGRAPKYPEELLYDVQDVARVVSQFKVAPYRQPTPITDSISVTFFDAGHILGSAMLELDVTEGGTTRKILFSGDIGQANKPLTRDPTLFTAADYVVMESTYGNRNHDAITDVESQLVTIIHETVGRGGNIVIPTFAIERAQELMYYLSRLLNSGRIPDLPVYLDSPMSVDATEIFRRFPDCFDAETWQLIRSNVSPFKFPGLRMTRTADESKAINRAKGSAIIMASSGMCNAGRIKHHLRQNISRPESTILFVGYQSHGTLGRQILDGQRDVRIHGDMLRVKARVAQIYGFSGHADRTGLLKWLGNLRQPPRQVFLAHGEEEAAEDLATHIRDVMKWPVSVPEYQSVVELS